MDFSKLVQIDLTPLWLKDIVRSLSPYPYPACILVISFALAGGAVLAQLSYLLLRPILDRFYSRYGTIAPALHACIRKMIIPFVSCLPPLFAILQFG